MKNATLRQLKVFEAVARNLSCELRSGSLAVLDVRGFPLMPNWYVVHRRPSGCRRWRRLSRAS